MGYLLAAISALVWPLLAQLLVHAGVQGALSPSILMAWSLFPFAVLRLLYCTCARVGQRVMFLAGATAVLLACLGALVDGALMGCDGATGALLLLLPRYLSLAFLVIWSVAWMVDFFYRRSQHHGGHIGWGVDAREDPYG